MKRRDLAVFDLCGTLYTGNLLFAFTRLQPECEAAYQVADTATVKALDALLPRRQIRRRRYFKALEALPASVRDDRARRFVRDKLPEMRRRDAFEALESLRVEGWRIALLSGAPDCVVRAVSDAVEADAYIGAPFDFGRVWQYTNAAKDRLMPSFEPYERLFVCTDNPNDVRLLRMADERLIFTSQDKLGWWLRQFGPAPIRLKGME